MTERKRHSLREAIIQVLTPGTGRRSAQSHARRSDERCAAIEARAHHFQEKCQRSEAENKRLRDSLHREQNTSAALRTQLKAAIKANNANRESVCVHRRPEDGLPVVMVRHGDRAASLDTIPIQRSELIERLAMGRVYTLSRKAQQNSNVNPS